MSTIRATPNPAVVSTNVDVDGSDFNPRQKFKLVTVNTSGVETGQATVRPRRDRTFHIGIAAPSTAGACRIRAYQGTTKVADIPLTVVVSAPTPPPPPPAPDPTPSPPAKNKHGMSDQVMKH